MDLFHKSTRARAFQSFRCQLVVLACCDGSRTWRHGEREMGRAVHNRLGWKLDHRAIVGSNWGSKNRYPSEYLPLLVLLTLGLG